MTICTEHIFLPCGWSWDNICFVMRFSKCKVNSFLSLRLSIVGSFLSFLLFSNFTCGSTDSSASSASVPVSSIAPKESTQSKKNILFISIDDLRPVLTCYGNQEVQTPNIDKLCSNSAVFTKAYAQYASCNPSRSSLLTGLLPEATGVIRNSQILRNEQPDIVTLPQNFRNQGYKTYGLGKVFHEFHDARTLLEDPMSWDYEFHVQRDPLNVIEYHDPVNLDKRNITKRKRIKSIEFYDDPDESYDDGKIASKACSLLKSHRDSEPFFLAVGFKKPHLPFVAPKKYRDLYDELNTRLPQNTSAPQGAPTEALIDFNELRGYDDIPNEGKLNDSVGIELKKAYYSCVSFIDAQIGRIMKTLEQEGYADNTIVVIWGDHGFKLGEYGSWAKNSNYSVDIHVPLIVHHPGTRGRKTVKEVVGLIDLFPTLCELAGVNNLPDLHGNSFAQLCTGSSTEKTTNAYAFSQVRRKGMMGYSIINEDFHYIKWVSTSNKKKEKIELYDLKVDSKETKNRAANPQNRSILDQMDVLLEEQLALIAKRKKA